MPIAVGHALATPNKQVYCMISDGECAEGSIWEALRFIHDNKIDNLHVYVNINGMGAYDMVDSVQLAKRLQVFLPRINLRFSEPHKWSFAEDLLTHYYVLKPEDYAEITQ